MWSDAAIICLVHSVVGFNDADTSHIHISAVNPSGTILIVEAVNPIF